MSGENKKRKKEDVAQVSDKAKKWAGEFETLQEEDQYTYLEEVAKHMSKMHLKFLQGILGFQDDEGEEEEGFDEEEDSGEGDDEGDEDDAAGDDPEGDDAGDADDGEEA